LEDRLAELLLRYDQVLAVLDERVQTRAPLQAPSALETIQRLRKLRGELGSQPEGGESLQEQVWRGGLELQSLTEKLEDCAGKTFPRRATDLYGIAEELARLGKGEG
jgi:hypothetical protein